MHRSIRPTRSLAVAAAMVTVGALALPVSAAFAQDGDHTGSDDTTVSTAPPTTDQATTDQATTDQSETEAGDAQDATEAPESGEAEDADETDDHASTGDDVETPTPDAPAAPVAPAAPWHVKARLADRDSAVVAWRDADTTGVTFTVALVPVGRGAAALPTLTDSTTTHSLQLDGLVAGARYRATVTASTGAASVVSAQSNVLVTPKAKRVKHVKQAKPTRQEHAAKAGARGTHIKPVKHAKPVERTPHSKHVTHTKATERAHTHAGKRGR